MPSLLNRRCPWRWLAALCAFFMFFSDASLAQNFLDPLMAFRPTVRALDDQTLEVRFRIEDGYYLYRDKFRFAVDEEAPVALGEPDIPQGKSKQDATFGRVEVFYKEAVLRLPIQRKASGALAFSLRVTSQGCADAGLCYPPQTQTLSVELPTVGSLFTAAATPENRDDESGRIATHLKNTGFWGNIVMFFLAGLMLAFTPCVLPMIPILSGIIVGQDTSRGQRLALSMVYVLGMALTYTLVGIAAGLSGELLSLALQNVWVLSAFAGVFVLLALAMFGFYELQLPTALQSWLSTESGRIDQRFRMRKFLHGLGVFVMGALSALIVGPCVTAPLAGALLYIGTTGDALLGGAALFAMAMGMGVPLMVVGVSAATLPKSGPWMDGIKKAFGVLLLATAVWIISPVIPVALQMLAWALLLIIPAIYLHALDPLPPHAGGWMRFWKGVGIVMLLVGVALLAGLLGGSRDPLRPLDVFKGATTEAEMSPGSATAPTFERIANLEALEIRMTKVRTQEKKPVMLDFYADWCVACKEMERFTFSDPAVRARLEDFVLLQVDVTANNADDQALLKTLQVLGPPSILFFNAEGREMSALRVIGFQNAKAFLNILEQASMQ